MYGCSIHYGKIINKMASKMLRTKQCNAKQSKQRIFEEKKHENFSKVS